MTGQLDHGAMMQSMALRLQPGKSFRPKEQARRAAETFGVRDDQHSVLPITLLCMCVIRVRSIRGWHILLVGGTFCFLYFLFPLVFTSQVRTTLPVLGLMPPALPAPPARLSRTYNFLSHV